MKWKTAPLLASFHPAMNCFAVSDWSLNRSSPALLLFLCPFPWTSLPSKASGFLTTTNSKGELFFLQEWYTKKISLVSFNPWPVLRERCQLPLLTNPLTFWNDQLNSAWLLSRSPLPAPGGGGGWCNFFARQLLLFPTRRDSLLWEGPAPSNSCHGDYTPVLVGREGCGCQFGSRSCYRSGSF